MSTVLSALLAGVVLVFPVAVTAAASGGSNAGQPSPAEGESDYKVGRQDLLEIRVFDLEELNQTVRVSPDGSISLPLLGRLQIAGMTITEVESLIADDLDKGFMRGAQVTVFVKEYESQKVTVSGAVNRPGSYAMLGPKTLLELISMAGGLRPDFGDVIVVFRKEGGESTRRISIDLESLVRDADPVMNIALMPGDIIYVPVMEMTRIFVGGAVRSPGMYEFPRREPITLVKAITLAGGTTDRAAEKKIQITRTSESGERTQRDANLKTIRRGTVQDPLLRDGDLVFVPERFF